MGSLYSYRYAIDYVDAILKHTETAVRRNSIGFQLDINKSE